MIQQMKMQEDRKSLRINVRKVVAELDDFNDEGAPGIYSVSFNFDDSGLTDQKRASIALDIFHAHQGIDCLDNFVIGVIDSSGNPVLQDETHVDYSFSDSGDVEKISDTSTHVIQSTDEFICPFNGIVVEIIGWVTEPVVGQYQAQHLPLVEVRCIDDSRQEWTLAPNDLFPVPEASEVHQPAEMSRVDGKLPVSGSSPSLPAPGTIGFYAPDPGHDKSPNVVLSVSDDSVTVYAVPAALVFTLDRGEWMDVDQMTKRFEEVAFGTPYNGTGPMVDMRDRMLKGYISTMADAVKVKDSVPAILLEHSQSLGASTPEAGKLPETQADTRKVRANELGGLALDWAVATCEGYTLTTDGISNLVEIDGKMSILGCATSAGKPCGYSPRSYWDQGGPIIQRKRINIQFCRDLGDRNGLYIYAEMDTRSYHGYWRGDHDQPLTAAMRCYVASKLGEVLEIPAKLLV